jgi:hypothetical protein
VLRKDIEVFAQLDHYLMRKIIGAHSKVPLEMLYLETATIPIEYIIASRRINYLHTVVSRDNNELVRRVYDAQRKNPSKGDWCDMVNEDMNMIGLRVSVDEVNRIPKQAFKKLVEKHVRSATFESLQKSKASHSKVKSMQHHEFKRQDYMDKKGFSPEQVAVLFNMRCNTINGFKMSFKSVYGSDTMCKLGCNEDDSIAHTFECEKIDAQCVMTSVRECGIFDDRKEQNVTVSVFMERHKVRTALIEAVAASQGHGQVLDTSTPADAGCAGARTGEPS